jgi:hypothetical protein
VARLARDDFKRGQGSRGRCRRQASGVDEAAGAVSHQFANRTRRAEIAAIAAKRFGQRADLQQHKSLRAGSVVATPAATDDADAMRIVRQQPRIMC